MPVPKEAGQTPSEFGGVPGLYGNVDPDVVFKATKDVGQPYDGVDPVSPHQARMSLTQTDSTDPLAMPAYGGGGEKTS